MNLYARVLVSLAFVAALSVGGCAAASDDDGASTDSDVVTKAALKPVAMTDAERKNVVEKKATCPFIGAAVFLKKLNVLNSIGNPLARISEVAALGDEGGGNLGSIVLTFFAKGNHGKMHAMTNNAAGVSVEKEGLTEATPPGTFSLDFPPSQGSHPGHSGMLEAGTRGNYHGALNPAAVGRLLDYAVDVDGKRKDENGFKGAKYIKRSDLGAFVRKNVSADDQSVYLFHGFSVRLLDDLRALQKKPSFEALAKLTGQNNLIGTSGEFGLLMTLLEQPDKEIDGEPVMLADDVKLMFVEKSLPSDWNRRPKTAHRWVANTMAILAAAEGDRVKP